MSLATDLAGRAPGLEPEACHVTDADRRIRFDAFELDPTNLELTRDGRPVPIHPLPARLLLHLLLHRDRIVPKDELCRAIWPNTFVSDTALSSALRDLRRALEDGGRRPRIIRTYRGRGFRFVDEVTVDGVGADPGDPAGSGADAGALPFVGREGELERLRRRVRRVARRGQGGVIAIDGTLGAGKSALLRAIETRDVPVRRLDLACEDELWAPPHVTLAELLGRLLPKGADDGSKLAAQARRFARDGEGGLALGADPHAEVASLLASCARERPLVVTVDDLHAADPASASLLLGLARALRLQPVLLVLALDPGRLHPDVVGAWSRASGDDRLSLGGLGLGATERIADALHREPVEEDWLRMLHFYTAGHVATTIELLRVASRHAPDPPLPPKLPVPEPLRRALGRRIVQLPFDTRRALVAATVLPPRSDPALVREVAGVAPDAPLDLEPAVRAGWIERVPGSQRFRLASPFLKRIVLDAVSPERRRQASQRALRASERQAHEDDHHASPRRRSSARG